MESAYGPYWPSAPADQRTEGGIWPRGPMKPPTRAQYSVIGQDIKTHGIEWMSLTCGRQVQEPTRRPASTSDTRSRLRCQTDSLAVGKGEEKTQNWEGSRSIRWEIETQDIERVSVASVGLEKVRLSGREALAGVRQKHNTHCVGQVSVASVGLEKVRLSGREALAGVRQEIKTHWC
ncbi:hypothetical protein G5714_005758 [Onychostoma macrolepis]|uniref:Uncharacterized protein n=1 Tax=Onychostoma macrolepis TaxID=369639 RepID=A0A7J6D1X4_9TELE|nr:hypothetical protein G5714_005758 [Onychostoma macrolepis]